jgi:hypothetical protein
MVLKLHYVQKLVKVGDPVKVGDAVKLGNAVKTTRLMRNRRLRFRQAGGAQADQPMRTERRQRWWTKARRGPSRQISRR